MNKKTKSIKTPPNSKESEMMVLGSMLTSVNALNVACDLLEASDFYYSEHKRIFDVLKQAYCNDRPADIHLISEELKRQEKLEEIGGIAYLTALAQFAGTSAYVEQYAQLIKDKSLLRKMIDTSQGIEKKALEEPEDVQNILDHAQASFFSLSEQSQDHQAVLLKELLSGHKGEKKLPYLKDLQEKQEHFQKHGDQTGGIVGIPTHFSDLDKVLGGMAPSNLIILAARPAMGKTALALNIAENICVLNSTPVAIFSLEMSAEQLLHRVICSQSEVESDKIKTGSLDGNEYQRIVSCVNRLQKHQMIIDDQPGLKITDLRSRARRMKELYKIEFIVIDYLQLLSGSGNFKSNESRQMEISEISRMLKNLARELNIPILCLSQLSRKVEERQGHRPMMSDLRESGCVTGDTLIKDANTNEVYTIQQLAERKEQKPIYVYGMDENYNLVKAKMTKAFSSGRKMTYRLIMHSGKEIKASANHPFRKLEGWKRLDELQIQDRIALPKKHLIHEKSNIKEILHTDNIFQKTSSTILQSTKKTVVENLASDIYWDEIKSIEPLREEFVYDATVEGIHNFIANDIIIHNSIEQDSDQVLFLLRREYYDPYDKPGLAELIVAKNRHGSVGNIQLVFRKELAQFANYTSEDPSDNNDEAFSAFDPES